MITWRHLIGYTFSLPQSCFLVSSTLLCAKRVPPVFQRPPSARDHGPRTLSQTSQRHGGEQPLDIGKHPYTFPVQDFRSASISLTPWRDFLPHRPVWNAHTHPIEDAREGTCSGTLKLSSMPLGTSRFESGRRTSSSPSNQSCGAGSTSVRSTREALGNASGVRDLS